MSLGPETFFAKENALGTKEFKEKIKKRRILRKECPICCETNQKKDKYCTRCGIRLY
ncbi:MAG: hypothetical protein ACW981_06915 [Candidatus Hodarchaeales archaeon]|jgi:hypothetical protein